jgi:hypothetical protein
VVVGALVGALIGTALGLIAEDALGGHRRYPEAEIRDLAEGLREEATPSNPVYSSRTADRTGSVSLARDQQDLGELW